MAPLAMPLLACAAGSVVISGAGPAGLLAAHVILSRRPSSTVTIFDRRADPRSIAASGSRAYSLGLNIRGRSALQRFDGLWEAVSRRGLLSDKFLLHVGGRELQLRSNQEGSVPTLLISRDELCAALLDELERQHDSERLRLRLGTSVESVDLARHECAVGPSSKERVPYDDLIGADGINSPVRAAMDAQAVRFLSEAVDLPGMFKVMVLPRPEALEPNAVHAMGAKGGYSLFSIPRADGQLCTLLAWSGEPPDFLGADDQTIAERISADLPKYGAPTPSALAQLRAQRPSKATTVRCNRYHDRDGRCLLLGDAAHSTGGTLGQGANSALLDCVYLDSLLASADAAEAPSIVLAVGEQFSARQQPEGLALWSLLQLPPKGPLRLVYLARQATAGFLARATAALPKPLRVERSVQSLLSESTTPFTQIVEANWVWVDAALAGAPGAPISEFALDGAHE
jgi:2-polyprenyl-6-methoxyphenol hydroxylase-like FAD-dependent oxidoreductase